MKRHGNLYPQICEMENLRTAYRNARRGKTWQRTVREFAVSPEPHLRRIQDLLVDKTFRTSPYHIKTIHEPKEREIYILPFNPDRIVHHALMNVIEPIWERLFISDSYACRKGKGIHAGSRRAMEFVRRNAYCLKCDISKFYRSILHDKLFGIIRRKIKCPATLWLIEKIIYSLAGPRNIPIGNYTSQWFGNLYLNELDQLMKGSFRIRDYIRYCDDFLLFHEDKRFLGRMAGVIRDFLGDCLGLTLSKCDLFPVSRGVDFLGYRHFKTHILLRKSTAVRMRRRLRALPFLLASGKISKESVRSSLAAIGGWLKWSNGHNLSLALGMGTGNGKGAFA
jgi:RNA-directed DNA polymerase